MKKAVVRIVQRKRLADKASGVAENMYRYRVRLLPVFVMFAAILGLVYLRIQPQSSKVVSELIESNISQISKLSILWSPLAAIIVLTIGALMYMWMDYQVHKKPLISVSPKTKYGMLHHLRLVVLPRFKYRWRPAFYWLAVAEVCVAVFIAVIVIIGLPSASAYSGSGLGTEQSPYQISTCLQLQEMGDDLAGFYELSGNIDCTGTSTWNSGDGFAPVASFDDPFAGTLDGKGFTIDGISQDNNLSGNDGVASGIFGAVSGATLKNFKITNGSFHSDGEGVCAVSIAGGIVNSNLSDISVSGEITVNSTVDSSFAGGFAAQAMNSTLSRLSTNLTITHNILEPDNEKPGITAGLFGLMMFSTLTDSYSSGTLTQNIGGTGDDNAIIGGLTGQVLGGSLTNSYSSMDLTLESTEINQAENALIGGISGMMSGVQVDNNFVSGTQTIPGNYTGLHQGAITGIGIYVPGDENFGTNISGTNNFVDVVRVGLGACLGTYLDENFDVNFGPGQTPVNFCTTANVGNTQPNYFFNNSTNPPFKVGSTQNWDFTNVWKTVPTSTPIFKSQAPGVPEIPGKVRTITTTSSNATSLTADWLAPLDTGNTPITNYAVQYKLHSSSTWTPVTRSVSTTRSQLISGLTAGQQYDVRVAAINAVGQSDWELLQNVSTSQLPTVPRNLVVSGVAQTGQLEPYYFPKLDWQVPETGAPITDYVIQYKPHPGPDWDLLTQDADFPDYDWAANNGTWTTVVDGVGNTLSRSFGADDPFNDEALAAALIYSMQGETQAIDNIDFRIAAVNTFGQGPWSDAQNFQVFIGITACQQMHDVLDEFPGSIFHLLNNINCSDTVNWNGGQGWDPIQDQFTPFQGDLYGNGYTISNLHIENQDDYVVGLFAYAENSLIRDLTLSNVSIKSLKQVSDSSMAAPLIGVAQGETILTNVHVTGSVSGPREAGGIVGAMGNLDGPVIWSDLSFDGEVKGELFSGGLMSGFVSPGQLTIEHSQSHGTIDDAQGAGGIAAIGQGLTLSDVESDMTIVSGCKSSGGLIGTLQGGSIINSSFNGSLDCTTITDSYFSDPRAVAVDSLNQVYVLGQTYTPTIYKYSPTGDFLAQWNFVENSSVSGNPSGIAVDSQDRVYVSDKSYNEVRVFSSTGQLLQKWSTPDPGKLTVDADNNVFVVSGDKVRKYSQTGTLLDTWDGGGAFGQLYDVAVANDGRIYVSDINQDRIYVLDSSGGVITSFDSESTPSATYQGPVSIALDNTNNLFVLNGNDHHVSVFDTNYQTIDDWQTPNSEVYSGSDMAMRTDGKILLLGTKINQISPNGNVESTWAGSSFWYGSDGGGIAGGLVGVYGGTSEALSIQNSNSSGTITSRRPTSKGVLAGGLLGAGISIDGLIIDASHPEQSLTSGIIINNSSSSVDIDASGEIVVAGGLVGSSDVIDINNSSATGDINVTHDANFAARQNGSSGGILGIGMRLTRIRNTHATGQVNMEGFIPTNNQGIIAGGLAGSLSGWTDLEDIYSTGKVTVSVNEDCNPGQCTESSNHVGGLIGLISSNPSIPALSLVDNVYATGNVEYTGQKSGIFAAGLIGKAQVQYLQFGNSHATGNISIFGDEVVSYAGGLLGVLIVDHDVTAQKLYATGNVENESSIYTLGGASTSSGGLIGIISGQITLQSSYATGNIESVGAIGGLIGFSIPFDYGHQGTPGDSRTVKNSYATGNVTGRIAQQYYEENSDFGEGYVEYGTLAGGLVGSTINTNIEKSYASGTISNLAPEFADSVPIHYRAILSSATGGIVGSVSVQAPEDDPNDLTKISDSFSAATILDISNNPKGAIAGRFFRFVYPDYDPAEPDLNPSNLLSNNHYDAQGIQNMPCAVNQLLVLADEVQNYQFTSTEYNGQQACQPVNDNNQTPNYFKNNSVNPPLNTWDFASPIWYQHVTTYPTFQVGDTVPGPPRNLAGVPTTSSMALSWQAPISDGGSAITNYHVQYRVHGTNGWTEFSHAASTATSYTITGLSSGTKYDFQVAAINAVGQGSWALGTFDVLSPGTPSNPQTPTTPTTPTRTIPRRPTGGGTSTSNGGQSQPQEEIPLLDVSKIPANELPSIFVVPTQKTKVSIVPYFFLSWLLLLALYFSYRAWRERQYRKAMDELVALTKNTQKNISDFLAITTHYLGTPLSILKGAIELIASKRSLQTEFVNAFKAKLLALQTTTDSLTKQNEQAVGSGQAVVTTEVNQGISRKQLWLPLVAIAVIIAVTDIVLMLSKSYDQTWGRTLNHLIWAAFGGLAVVISFAAWNKQKKLHAQYRQTLDREKALLAQKNLFLESAAGQLTAHSSQLRQGTDGLEQFPDTKLLVNGLVMLDKIASSLAKVQRFSAKNNALPILNVQQIYTRDILPALQKEAQAKGVKLINNIPADITTQMLPEELQQVLMSVAQNAVQFSKSVSTVTIGAKMGSGKSAITITDEGSGITPEAQQHLFEPLTRGVDTATFNHEGLGLNLFIDRMIVQKYGGDIQISSKPNQGTTVTIDIPKSGKSATGAAPQVITPGD